jgi:hypothetical protein
MLADGSSACDSDTLIGAEDGFACAMLADNQLALPGES